jgi:hypothetical protein
MAGFLLCTVLLLIMFNLFYTSSNDKNHNEKHTKDIYNNNYEYEDFDDSVGYGYIDIYIRSNGTRVSGHYRTDADEYEENNFNYKGEESADWDYEYHD